MDYWEDQGQDDDTTYDYGYYEESYRMDNAYSYPRGCYEERDSDYVDQHLYDLGRSHNFIDHHAYENDGGNAAQWACYQAEPSDDSYDLTESHYSAYCPNQEDRPYGDQETRWASYAQRHDYYTSGQEYDMEHLDYTLEHFQENPSMARRDESAYHARRGPSSYSKISLDYSQNQQLNREPMSREKREQSMPYRHSAQGRTNGYKGQTLYREEGSYARSYDAKSFHGHSSRPLEYDQTQNVARKVQKNRRGTDHLGRRPSYGRPTWYSEEGSSFTPPAERQPSTKDRGTPYNSERTRRLSAEEKHLISQETWSWNLQFPEPKLVDSQPAAYRLRKEIRKLQPPAQPDSQRSQYGQHSLFC